MEMCFANEFISVPHKHIYIKHIKFVVDNSENENVVIYINKNMGIYIANQEVYCQWNNPGGHG